MRSWVLSATAIAVISCGGREQPTPPTVIGTLICVPHTNVLGANATLPDEVTETEALQREVVAQVTGEAFVHRVAVDERFDEAAIGRAVSARPVKDSRLVEIGVALPDRALATRVCDAMLDHYVTERSGGGDPIGTQRDDVTVLDHCGPPHPRQ